MLGKKENAAEYNDNNNIKMDILLHHIIIIISIAFFRLFS